MKLKLKQSVLLAGALLAGVAFGGSGLNPQFIKWQKMKAAGLLPSQQTKTEETKAQTPTPRRVLATAASARGATTAAAVPLATAAAPALTTSSAEESEQGTGLMPDVASLDYLCDLIGAKIWKPYGGFPKSFDLRTYNCVTSVKEQGWFNTCWAFASLGSLESSVLRQKPEGYTYTAADVDFSELHLVNNSGFDIKAVDNGTLLMSLAYLLRWGGPASETDAPYPANPSQKTTAWPTNKYDTLEPRLHLQGVKFLPARNKIQPTKLDTIKDALMNYGAVYVTYYADENNAYNSFNSTTKAFCCKTSHSANHAVLIVGWNDDYSKSNFNSKSRPKGNGAFIVKNSWGSNWGDEGYFYISYYDVNFGYDRMAVLDGSTTTTRYGSIYEYDTLGYTGGSHAGNASRNNPWMANVFTAETDDTIEAVGFYALAPKTKYNIRVYTDCGEDGEPSDGNCEYWTEADGTIDFAGYVTIPLETPVCVKAGTRFAVCVQLYSPGFPKEEKTQSGKVLLGSLAYEEPVAGYSSKATAEAGQSFYSPDGEYWTDLTLQKPGANFCLKAYGTGLSGDYDLYPIRLEIDEGPSAIAAGGQGLFTVSTVYNDQSRKLMDVTCELIGGQESVESVTTNGANIAVVVRDGLTADVEVGLRVRVTDRCYNAGKKQYDDVTVSRDISFTAAKRIPDAPTDLTASAGDTDAGVRLTWTAVEAAATYAVYRSESESSAQAKFIAKVDGLDSYTDTTADPCKDYTYFLKAQNTAGSSSFSVGTNGWRALSIPSDLTASDGDFDYVQLVWAEVSGAHYYRIYRADEVDADGNPINAIPVSDWIAEKSFRDTPPLKGHPYFYFVKAAYSFTGYRPSGYSIFDLGNRMASLTVSSVQIQGPGSILSGSTNCFTLAASLSNGARVDPATGAVWTCSLANWANTAGGIDVEALFGGHFVATNTIVVISAEWTLTNEDGTSKASDTRYVTIVPVVPAVPKAPKVIEVDASTGVTIQWEPVDGASSYRLYRGLSIEKVEEVNLAGVSFEPNGDGYVTVTDSSLVPGVGTYYWIASVNAAGTSAKSGASAITRRRFMPPRNVTASNGSLVDMIHVSWGSVDAAGYYRLYRAESKDGAKEPVTGWITKCQYDDAKIVAGKQYWYFVTAASDADGTDESAFSEGVPGYPDPARTLSALEIDGPSVIPHDSKSSYFCTAVYADGSHRNVIPTWSFKQAVSDVEVGSDGVVVVGAVSGENDISVELQASFTDRGVTQTASYPITIITIKPTPVAQVFVSNIVVTARWPWNGLIDIKYDLWSNPGTASAIVSVFGYDHDLKRSLEAVTLSGDGIDAPAMGGTPHKACHVVWNLGADYTNFHASAFSVSVEAVPFSVAAPEDFRASDNTSTNAVELNWAEAFGAQYYEIFRSTGTTFDGAERIASVTNLISFSDDTATAGETYYYWIRTVDMNENRSTEAGPVKGIKAPPPYHKENLNLRSGLVAYYPFNETLDDFSGSSNHLAVVTGDAPASVAARSEDAGTAYAFAGATKLDVATNGVTALAGSFTFAAWVKTSEKGTLRTEQASGFNTGCNFLVHPFAANGESVTYGLSVVAGGVNVFERDATHVSAVLKYATDLSAGWHHVAVTVNANGAPTLYVDGAYAKTGLKTDKTKVLGLGAEIGGGEYGHFKGSADDVCYYDRALDVEEIAALAEAGSPLVADKPISVRPTVSVTYATNELGVVEATVSIVCEEIDTEHGQEVVQPTVRYSIVRNDGGDTVESREYTGAFKVEGNATVIAWSEKADYYDSARVIVEIRAGWQADVRNALGDGNGAIVWSTDGDGEWVFDPSVTYDQVVGSMRSGKIGDNETSRMTATFTGAGYFAFDCKVSSESGFDFLDLVVDGETVHKLSGNVDWTEIVLSFTNEAEHVVSWAYVKDGGTSRGSDCAWVDYVQWIPAGTAVAAPTISATRIDEGLTNLVTISCLTADATIKYKLSEEGDWLDYTTPFELIGDGTVYAYAKAFGLTDSLMVKSNLRRSWLIRMRHALIGDDVTKAKVALLPDYESLFTYDRVIPDENLAENAARVTYWWDEDRTVTSDGGFASAKSPKLDHDDWASIFATVTGYGTLIFDRRVDSEAGWDVLTYYAGEDGYDFAYAEAISGQIGWERVKIVFATDHEHVIEWEYDKDGTGSSGLDAGWIDNFRWAPGVFAPAEHSEKIGYTFVGWATNETGAAVYEPGVMLDADAGKPDFYERWSANPYTVVYNAKLSEYGRSTRQPFVYDQEQTLYPATNFVFTRGYAFAGWSTNANGTVDFSDSQKVKNLATELGAVVTLNPTLAAVAYNVSFWEGNKRVSGVSDIAAHYDEAFTFPTPAERDGWRFDGWAYSPTGEVAFAAGSVGSNFTATAGADIRFYANWTQLTSPLVIAVDIDEFDFDTNTTWFVQTNVVHQGDSALQSGKISGSQSSTLTAVYAATNKTRFTFWWKVSSEPTYDTLKFTVNGKAVAAISGLDGDWQKYSTVLSTGENKLEWTYAKDSTGDRGSDCGWLDHMSLEFIKVVSQDGDVFVAENGSDVTGDGSEANPFRTIQMGVDCVDDGKTVHVKPGMYPSFVSNNRSITIESTEGASNTIVDGAFWKEAGVTNCCAALGNDPVTPGARSYYCNTKLIGFTLQHGSNGVCGGTVYNSIIQDCYCGDDGGGALGSTLYNCVLTRNYAADGCGATSGGACRSCTLYNCTVYNNRARSNGAGITYSVAYNCIIWHNYEDNGRETNVTGGWYNSVYNCITDKDPLFTDAANGDFTLQQNSPAIDAGNSSVVTYSTDLAGNGRIGGDAVDCGAYEFDPSTIVPVAEPVFKVIQYCINKQPYTVDDAVAATNTPSIWKHDPVTETYDKICFRDNAQGTRQNFQSSAVQWPATIQDGYKSDYFAVQITGTVNVPETGKWTFCVGSDDGYKMILEDEDGKQYTMQYYRDRSYANDIRTFNLTKAGRYKVYIIYFEYVQTSILEVSCAKGSYSWFNSSRFKLLGTPESGIPLVSGNN